MNPSDFDQYPQGYARVRHALLEQGIPWADIHGYEDAWKRSRFSDSQSLYLVCAGVLTPGAIEQYKDAKRAAGQEVESWL